MNDAANPPEIIQPDEAVGQVRNFFLELQSTLCDAIAQIDGTEQFSLEPIHAPNGGLAQPRVLADGQHIEKAAVQFTHSIAEALPPAATERNPQLAGNPFQATAISLIIHPRNPHVPTTHMNLRFFVVEADPAVWYFGGGYDLTPYYPVTADIVHWHQVCADAAGDHYPRLKERCDEYFFLPHRQEPRGVGGLFFDDWTLDGFTSSFAFVQGIGQSFWRAYEPILSKRLSQPFTPAQRDFQLYRRGRYAEFNLLHDRGTRFGLMTGGKTEAILMSLPPEVRWP